MTSVQGFIEALPLLHRFRRQITRQRLLPRLRQRKERLIRTLPQVLAQIELRVLNLRM